MGWSDMEEEKEKKQADLSTKILIAIIVCLLLIIVLIFILLINIKQTTYTISVDGKEITTTSKTSLLATIDEMTYVNIEEFTKLVGYEYHEGEYKSFTIEKDKCYVQGKEETATFYLNDNKVSTLPVNKLTEDYREFTVEEGTIKEINEKMYAPIKAINLAFNAVLEEEENYLKIYTLDYLVTLYDAKVKQWGYTSIAEQSFENKKSLLYGCLIVKKESGLYKIIDNNNTKEIVSDKYNKIEFTENTKEFFVTNSLEQVGIINLDGTTKIEPVYNSISVLDKKSDLYLIQKDDKYGVVKSGNITIVFPEYDSIGVKSNITTDSQYLILDTLIPVCKNNKWGAFNKNGAQVYKTEYEALGCDITTVEVNGVKKVVSPVLSIERCKGVVVKKEDKYGVLDLSGKELVPIAVESIYQIENIEDEEQKYFMIYNKEELNVIERLIKAGLIESNIKEETANKVTNTTINNTIVNNNTTVKNEAVNNNNTNNTQV